MNSLKEIADTIAKYNQVVICGHIDPDGDCLGSMLALGTALKKQGKKVRLVLERTLPDNLSPLEEDWDYCYTDDFVFEPEDQLLIVLDSGALDRIPELPPHKLPIINIDHHMSNTFFGDYNYVDERAAAAGEIVYLLLEEMGIEIDQKIGYYIAVSIISDTGCFRYSNTNPRILRLMADLLEMGIDTASIYKDFLASHPLRKIRLRGLVYSRMKTAFDGRVAWVVIDQEMLKEAGATVDDTGSISSELRDIKGVEVGVSILEREPGLIQLGLRSNDYVPVNEVAMIFGGGGHLRAAGARVRGDLEEISKKVLQKIGEYLE
ncbi:DHH family phosphoesterase [Anoxybacter fermentans]|nr:bifunctional oligoribonuclease/PAP phosphatase NrnA [Anoxybacter fermentans]